MWSRLLLTSSTAATARTSPWGSSHKQFQITRRWLTHLTVLDFHDGRPPPPFHHNIRQSQQFSSRLLFMCGTGHTPTNCIGSLCGSCQYKALHCPGSARRRHMSQWGGTAAYSDLMTPNSLALKVTEFDRQGNRVDRVIRKSEILFQYGIQARDIRFSSLSSLFTRSSSIILKLQHIKAIINCDSVVLLDSEHPAIQEFLPEMEERLKATAEDPLPFEFRALETMLMKIFTVLDDRLQELDPALRDVLNSLLDPRLFSVDRGQLHILLHQSKCLSEFYSIVHDIEGTLTDMLDSEDDMAEMYLTHWATTGVDRDPDDIEEINNILEAYLMQAENIMSELQKLRELIDQSESIILINLDSQRNVMMRLSLQLEMGTFSAAITGLVGVAFGMNLDSSLEENPYAFWVLTGLMVTACGLLWRRLLTFLGKNLDRVPLKKLTRPKK